MIDIGFIQICSVLDPVENLNKIDKYLAEAAVAKVKYVFLPECFYSMSSGQETTPYLVAQENEHFKNIQSLAKKHQLYLLGGSVAFDKDGTVVNRNLNFSPEGKELAHYDKRFLFNCNLKDKVIDEADIYTEGNNELLLEINELKIGVGICFDLRFPEIWMSYRKQGANLLTVSSAFTVPTGKAHWHTLLKARAIETQSYVVACGQVGKNNERISTFGHSLIIDPWGEILVDAKEKEGFFKSCIDLKKIQRIRNSVGMERYF